MESETQPTQTTTESVAKVSPGARRILACTMAGESVLVMGLTLRDFALTQTPLATLSSVAMLAISGVSIWAAYETWTQGESWLALSLLSQFSIAALCVYIVLIDLRSPFLQFDWASGLFPVTGVASIIGLFASFWVLFLVRRWRGPVSAGMKAIATLIPLVGFGQFWLQTDYLPRTSVPVVDLTTEMSPLGQTRDIVHLEAKVTINNRNSVPVYVGATLMRITAYPQDLGKQSEVSDALEFGYAKSQAYRDKPLSVAGSKLLYAKDVLHSGAPLAAGQSVTVRRVVDFDSQKMRLARLAVDAFFITNPGITEYACPSTPGGPQKTPKDGESFENALRTKMVNPAGAQFLCREIRLAPQNVVHEIVGDRPSYAIEGILSDPKNPDEEYPRLLILAGADKRYDLDPLQYQRVRDANPPMEYEDMAVEYSPSDESAPPKQK
jgi:hypothetical protein